MPVHASFCLGQTDCRILLEPAMDVYTNCSLCAVHKVSTVCDLPRQLDFALIPNLYLCLPAVPILPLGLNSGCGVLTPE